MNIVRLTEVEDSVISSNNGLKVYLNNLVHGRPETPRSWLYEGKDADQILRDWMTQLESVKSFPHGDLVFQFDTAQLSKWGPQGKVAPLNELMDIVTRGFKKPEKPTAFSSPEWQQAKANVIADLLKANGLYHTLRPRGYKAVLDDMSTRDTLESNSGWPLFTRRKSVSAVQHAIADAKSGAYLTQPAIALFRNYNAKTRLVWMYPMATNLQEGRFTQPLKEALTRHTDLHFIDPWRGYNAVKSTLTDTYESGACIAASDFAFTDEHFTRYITLEVFDVIKHAFQPQYWDELKESMLHINKIPLIVSPTQKVVGWHGVSSGSNWTNDIETYFDRILAEYIKILQATKYKPLMAIGDDMSHELIQYSPEFAAFLEKVGLDVGMEIKAEKTTNEPNWVKFLQRLTIRGVYSEYRDLGKRVLRGIYPTVRALNSSVYPEKFHSPKKWSKELFACRQFMILENTVDHYLFKQFVAFVVKGNPYLKQFAKLKASKLDAIQREAKLLPGLNPTFNQEKRDSRLSEFESIKYAKTL
nr:RNA-dependent RNA polymerase [Picobirnavirus sp.]